MNDYWIIHEDGEPLLQSNRMEIDYDDGGREAAGFKGHAGDCVTRAIAIATQQPYLTVYNALNELAKKERRTKARRGKRSSARTGVFSPTTRKYMAALGWTWTPTMGIGTGCRVHLRKEELPMGRIICVLSGHLVAVVDHIIRDTGDPQRGGTRCVYGYWRKE